jgi:hypothetical protein
VILVIPVLVSAGIVYATVRLHAYIRALFKALNPAWLWFSGHALDGQSRTNATWTKPSHGTRPVLHNSGSAVRWHHMPRLHRAGIRTGASLAFLAVLYGLYAARTVTVTLLASVAAVGVLAGVAHLAWKIRRWPHERHRVRPLERTLISKLTTPPVCVEVECDGDTVKSVAIEWPPETELGTVEQQVVLEAVTTRLPIEAPDPAWKLKGRERSVTFTQSEPVRSYVEWEGEFAEAVQRAALDELVFGPGKRDAINTAKYSQSPHLMIPGESGGGKSNLAAVLLLQEMMRGSLIFNLDPKWISHLWLQNLPNVINAHETPHLHLALCWLGKELVRRTKVAYYSAGGTGRVRGKPGRRIIVLAEELNYGMPGLKDHWREIREKDDPKQSPAITALSGLACAGRASDMHEWLIAQLMTVDSTGVKDSTIRTNAGIKAMARWNGPGWAMAVGKHIPMPPPSTIPGRIQLVTGDSVRETQVPYLHLDDKDEAVAEKAVQWARALAVSGDVAEIPGGPDGVPRELWPASVLGTDLPAIEAGRGHETVGHVSDMPVLVTLRQACAEEVLRLGAADPLGAARKASQRPGFPEVAGWDGNTALYHRSELAEWQNGKVRVLR